jgi:hypothetical protein
MALLEIDLEIGLNFSIELLNHFFGIVEES